MNDKIRNLITILITVLAVFGLLFVLNLITSPIIEENKMNLKIGEYSEILDGIVTLESLDIDDSVKNEVTDAQKALGANEKILGYLFTASKTNQWGSILIRASVDANGKITGVTSIVDQSIKPDETKEHIAKFKGSSIENPETLDGSTGPTTKDSVKTADELFESIKKAFLTLGITPDLTELELIYGEGAIAAKDEAFVSTDYILSRSIVSINDQEVGFLYEVEGTGVFENDNPEERTNIINFALDVEGVYLGQIIPEETYKHTKGYKRNVVNFLNKLIDTNIKDLVIEELDASTGATNSTSLAIEMLKALKEVINNE